MDHPMEAQRRRTRDHAAWLALVAAAAFALAACDSDETGEPSVDMATEDATGTVDAPTGADATDGADSAEGDATSTDAGETSEPTDTADPSETTDPTDATASMDTTTSMDTSEPGDTVMDGDGGGAFTPTTWVEDCLEGVGRNDARRLVFESANARVGMVRSIDPDALGTSGTAVFLADGFAIETIDRQVCVTDLGALDYTVSHHNFDDLFTAVDGALTWELAMTTEGYDMPFDDRVQVSDGSTVVWGPESLTFVSCTTLGAGSCQNGRRQ